MDETITGLLTLLRQHNVKEAGFYEDGAIQFVRFWREPEEWEGDPVATLMVEGD